METDSDFHMNGFIDKILRSDRKKLVEETPLQVKPQQQKPSKVDSNKILSVVFNILQDYCLSCNMQTELGTLCRELAPPEQQTKDANNNVNVPISCSARKLCSSPYEKQRAGKFGRKFLSGVKKHTRPVKYVEECTCDSSMKCTANSSCEEGCCNTRNKKVYKKISSSNVVKFQENSKKILPRQLQDDLKVEESLETPNSSLIKKEGSLDEYGEEMDKFQDIMNTVTGIPLKAIVNREEIRNTMSCEQKELISDESRKMESCSADCMNECMDSAAIVCDTFPMVITDGQGLVELHIVSLQLSTCAKQILYREGDISNVSLFVSWEIWNQEKAYTPTLKCPKLNFNSSFVYRISDLSSFFNYVLLEFVIFEVNVYHEDKDSYVAARGKLCIKDMLDYPQNKLHYIAPVNSVIPCTAGMNLGQLSLWVRLSCDVEKVMEFKTKRGIRSPSIEDSDSSIVPITRPSKIDLFRDHKEVSSDQDSEKSRKESDGILSAGSIPKKSAVSTLKFKEDSSDTSGDILKPSIQTSLEKSSLTVVKESEDEMEDNQSDQKQANGNAVVREDVSSSATHWKNEFENVSQDRDSAISKETDGTSMQSDLQAKSSSVLEFNALINDKKERETPIEYPKTNSIFDLTNVIAEKNWKKYKERSKITFMGGEEEESESLDSITDGPLDKDTIIIEVISLTLFPHTKLMQNEEYQLLYIEYCFLGNCGAEMETISLPKKQSPNLKLTYNFKRKFRVDEKTHAMQNNILRAMLDKSASPNIKFIVVCEPLPDDTDSKECIETGFANFNIREYALMNSEKFVSLPVYDTEEKEQIGILKISVLGLYTLRQYLARRDSEI